MMEEIFSHQFLNLLWAIQLLYLNFEVELTTLSKPEQSQLFWLHKQIKITELNRCRWNQGIWKGNFDSVKLSFWKLLLILLHMLLSSKQGKQHCQHLIVKRQIFCQTEKLFNFLWARHNLKWKKCIFSWFMLSEKGSIHINNQDIQANSSFGQQVRSHWILIRIYLNFT